MDAPSLIMAVAVLSGLYLAWNIGANDVANAMGTSVGSGALSLRRALVLAVVFEAAGAFLAGGRVTTTISQGLVSLDAFGGDAVLLSASMAACLIAAGIWLNFASYMGWPVSTTHCIVGAVAGAGATVGGWGALDIARLAEVGVAWVVSPLMAIWLGHQTFGFIRKRILGAVDPLEQVQRLGPSLAGAISALLVFAVLVRGDGPLRFDLPLWLTGVIALLVGAAVTGAARPMFRRAAAEAPAAPAARMKRTERVFHGLQVMAACSLAFAHGSNDIANAVGPVAVVFHGLRVGITEQVAVPPAVLMVGVVGMAIGLASYGYKVMATVGRDITELTASSGCAAAFSAAAIILVGSKLGLPVSTTHIMVGAVIGVGFGRGIAAINTRVLRSIFASWIATVPFTAALTAALVSVARSALGG